MKRIILFLSFAICLVASSQNTYTFDYPTENEEQRNVVIGSESYRIYEFWDTSKFKMFVDTLDLRLMSKLLLPGTSIQYVRGDGSIVSFPTIPTNTNQLTNGAGFITNYTETDPIFLAHAVYGITPTMISNWLTAYGWGNHAGLYAAAVHSHTFASLIDKPTTLSGYGITDAYPLSGNPSNFLTAEVDGSTSNEIELPTQTSNSGKFLTTNGSAVSWSTIPTQITHYNASGVISITKKWVGTVTPNTANGYSIDISSASFTNVHSVSVVAQRNTTSASMSPQVAIKSVSTSAIVVNVIEDNPATTTILGISVLSGAPSVFANTTGLTLHIIVEGN